MTAKRSVIERAKTMIDTMVTVNGSEAHLVRYESIADFSHQVERSRYVNQTTVPDSWAGGNAKDFHKGCARGDTRYAKRAERMMENFTNLTLKDYDRVLDWNLVSGVLDQQAAMSGDPMCMYGPTIEKTSTAPIAIYLDLWVSSSVDARVLELRGIAVLALVQILNMFRPVQLKVVSGMGYGPTRENSIQVIPVPTAPMDLARASWMIASPLLPRRGLYRMVYEIAKCRKQCAGPLMFGAGMRDWQTTQMGNWLAKREGINEVVHLPLMYGHNADWDSEEQALAWVKKTVARFVE